jgi:hypothetical protein
MRMSHKPMRPCTGLRQALLRQQQQYTRVIKPMHNPSSVKEKNPAKYLFCFAITNLAGDT